MICLNRLYLIFISRLANAPKYSYNYDKFVCNTFDNFAIMSTEFVHVNVMYSALNGLDVPL